MPELTTYELDGSVAKITVDDGKVNAMSKEMSAELVSRLDQAEAEIKERFGDSLDNEVMAEILRVAVDLRAARIATEAV